jgi:hypothetical protein
MVFLKYEYDYNVVFASSLIIRVILFINNYTCTPGHLYGHPVREAIQGIYPPPPN